MPEIFSANKVIIIVTTKMIVIKIIIAEKLKGPPLTYRVENTYFMCDSVYVLRGIARRRSSFFSSSCSRPFSKLISSPPSITPPSSPQRIPPEKYIYQYGFLSNTTQSIFADFLLHVFCGLNIWLRVWRGFRTNHNTK